MLIIICSLLVGGVIISESLNMKKINLKLFIEGDIANQIGNIECKTSSDRFIAEELVKCKITDSLKFLSGNVNFTRFGMHVDSRPIQNLTFRPPGGSDYIHLSLLVLNKTDDVELNVSVKNPMNFPTVEEDEERLQKTLKYIYGLVIVVLFSVPTLMINLRKLWRGD